MSDRQRYINKCISDIKPPCLVLKSCLRLYLVETEQASIKMLKDKIESFYASIRAPDFRKIYEQINDPTKRAKLTYRDIIFGKYNHKVIEKLKSKEEQQSVKTEPEKALKLIERGHNFLNNGLVQNALEYFNIIKESRHGKCYEERIIIALFNDDYAQAKHLSQKAGSIEGLFLSNVALCDFTSAAELLYQIMELIVKKQLTFCSVFELVHLVGITLLITMRSNEAHKIFYELLDKLSALELGPIEDLINAFGISDYKKIWENIAKLSTFFDSSLYARINRDKIIKLLKTAAIKITINPYGKIKITKVASKVGLKPTEVQDLIKFGITHALIKGRIDNEKDLFLAVTDDGQKELREYIYESQKIRQELELIQWQEKCVIESKNKK